MVWKKEDTYGVTRLRKQPGWLRVMSCSQVSAIQGELSIYFVYASMYHKYKITPKYKPNTKYKIFHENQLGLNLQPHACKHRTLTITPQ